MDGAQTSPNWSQILLTGVSAAIDSQIASQYVISDPMYNTQYGRGGQPQYGYGGYGYSGQAGGQVRAQASPIVWIIGAAVLLYAIKAMGGKL